MPKFDYPKHARMINIKTGEEFIYLRQKGKTNRRVVSVEAFETAKVEWAKIEDLEMRDSVSRYIPRGSAKLFTNEVCISLDEYNKKISTPENKPLLEKLRGIEQQKSAAAKTFGIAKSQFNKTVIDLNNSAVQINKQLFATIN